jgi:hypothetical protein
MPDPLIPRHRAGACAGILFAALSLLGIATIGRYPAGHDSAAAYVQYFLGHRAAILRTNALLSLANGALIVYFAHLRTALAARDRDSALPSIAFGGALLVCALGAAGAMLTAGLAWFGPAGIPAPMVKLLQDLYYTMNAFSAVPAALAVGAVAVAGLRLGAERWLVGLSAVVALVELAATFTLQGSGDFFSPAGAFGAPILYGSLTLWVLVVSVRALVRGRVPAAAAAVA